MKTRRHVLAWALFLVCGLMAPRSAGAQHAVRQATDGRPDAIIDLRTKEGADLVRGQWRYADARLSEVDSQGPGPDLRPSGPAVRTLDVSPKAGGADIDDSGWQKIAATSLEARRTNGKLSFNWYRINITVPARVGTFDTTGSTVIFEVVVDDYAEIWVDGKLPRPLGQTGGALVKGFNAPNRVVLTRNARPNQTIQLAVFGANGPLSDPPSNFIWIRSATLDFYKASPPATADVRVVRNDPAIDSIVPMDLKAERLAEGFPVHRGSRLGARGIPAVQRSERQHDLSMVGQRRTVGVQDEERVHRAWTSANTDNQAPMAWRSTAMDA